MSTSHNLTFLHIPRNNSNKKILVHVSIVKSKEYLMGSEILKTPERPKSNNMKEGNHKPKNMLPKKGLLKF